MFRRLLLATLALLAAIPANAQDRSVLRRTARDDQGRIAYDTGRVDKTPQERYNEWVRSGKWKFIKTRKSHYAVCRVLQEPDPGKDERVGSGALIWSDGTRGVVLTANHLLPSDTNRIRINWPAGKAYGTVGARDPVYDIALIKLEKVPGTAWVIPFDDQPLPRGGEKIAALSYGGMQTRLRGFEAGVLQADDLRLTLDSYAVSGDSGGAIVKNDAVIGVVCAANTHGAQMSPGGMFMARPTVGCGRAPTRRLLNCGFGRRSTRQYYQMGPARPVNQCGSCPTPQMFDTQGVCSPYQTFTGGPGTTTRIVQEPTLVDGNTGLPPPVVQQPPVQPPPVQPPPVQPPAEVEVKIDYDQLAGLVYERMLENPEPFRGADGAPGADGQPGRDGTDGQAGIQGQPGMPGERGPMGPPRRIGLVGKDGIIVETIEPDLDGTLRLPPVVMSIRWPDDKVFTQKKALGQEIRIKLVPED